MPVGCLGNTSSSDQQDLKNQSSVGSYLDEGGGGNGNKQQVIVGPRTMTDVFIFFIKIKTVDYVLNQSINKQTFISA